MDEPKIEYPCEWTYRIIGMIEDEMRIAIVACLAGKEYTLTVANKSSKGKYISLNLELTVLNEEERDSIFYSIKNHPSVKMVL